MKEKDLVNGFGRLRIEKHRVINGVEEKTPYDVIETPCNAYFSAGWNEILKLLTNQSTTHYNSTYATIGIGNSATAFSDAHTDLQGTSTSYKGMESAYPSVPASGQIQFKAKWLTSEGNFVWEEWCIKNSSSGIVLNRGLTGGGASYTKTNTEIWYCTATIGRNP